MFFYIIISPVIVCAGIICVYHSRIITTYPKHRVSYWFNNEGRSVRIRFIIDMFSAWYGAITDKDKDSFLILLNRFSSEVSIPENEAKRLLSLTDLIMTDQYYTRDDIRLSCLLKIKGNILDMLFDKVNARIYWTQAYRLNPNDEQLKERLQQ